MKMFKKVLSMLLAICLALPAVAGTRVVDCDAGDSLQKALNSGAGSAASIEVEVTGTCYETITLSRNRVTILGDGSTTIHGRLRIFGSQQVVIRNLTFTGPDFGLLVSNSRVRIFDSQIADNASSGILASDGAVIRLTRVQVERNWEGIRLSNSQLTINDVSVDSNETDGVLVLQNSTLSSNGGSISNDGVLGIRVYWSSSIVIAGTQIEGNSHGIQTAMASSGSLDEAEVINNAHFGVEVSGNSALNVNRGMVSGNGDNGIWVNAHSFLILSDAKIIGNSQNGVAITGDSGVTTHGFTQILNNTDYFQVGCDGEESSIGVYDQSVVGPIGCPHPSF